MLKSSRTKFCHMTVVTTWQIVIPEDDARSSILRRVCPRCALRTAAAPATGGSMSAARAGAAPAVARRPRSPRGRDPRTRPPLPPSPSHTHTLAAACACARIDGGGPGTTARSARGEGGAECTWWDALSRGGPVQCVRGASTPDAAAALRPPAVHRTTGARTSSSRGDRDATGAASTSGPHALAAAAYARASRARAPAREARREVTHSPTHTPTHAHTHAH
jgi:hypothetical protein